MMISSFITTPCFVALSPITFALTPPTVTIGVATTAAGLVTTAGVATTTGADCIKRKYEGSNYDHNSNDDKKRLKLDLKIEEKTPELQTQNIVEETLNPKKSVVSLNCFGTYYTVINDFNLQKSVLKSSPKSDVVDVDDDDGDGNSVVQIINPSSVLSSNSDKISSYISTAPSPSTVFTTKQKKREPPRKEHRVMLDPTQLKKLIESVRKYRKQQYKNNKVSGQSKLNKMENEEKDKAKLTYDFNLQKSVFKSSSKNDDDDDNSDVEIINPPSVQSCNSVFNTISNHISAASSTSSSSSAVFTTNQKKRGQPQKQHSDMPDPDKLKKLIESVRKYREQRYKNYDTSRQSKLNKKQKEESDKAELTHHFNLQKSVFKSSSKNYVDDDDNSDVEIIDPPSVQSCNSDIKIISSHISTVPPAPLASSSAVVTIPQRKRGRPRKQHSDMPDPNELRKLTKSERKYREQRYKNNESSRQSRLNRKQKEEKDMAELIQLKEKHKYLTAMKKEMLFKYSHLKEFLRFLILGDRGQLND